MATSFKQEPEMFNIGSDDGSCAEEPSDTDFFPDLHQGHMFGSTGTAEAESHDEPEKLARSVSGESEIVENAVENPADPADPADPAKPQSEHVHSTVTDKEADGDNEASTCDACEAKAGGSSEGQESSSRLQDGPDNEGPQTSSNTELDSDGTSAFDAAAGPSKEFAEKTDPMQDSQEQWLPRMQSHVITFLGNLGQRGGGGGEED